MKPSYLAGIFGGLLVAGASGAGACTYNTYHIEPTSSGSGGGGGATSSSASGKGASTSSTNSGAGGTGGIGPCPADVDSDGFVSWKCPNGLDCADGDDRALPNEANFYGTPIKTANGPQQYNLSYDYDCDGKETPEFAVVTCNPGKVPCSGSGFKIATPCGEKGSFGHCELSLMACGYKEDDPSKLQQCK